MVKIAPPRGEAVLVGRSRREHARGSYAFSPASSMREGYAAALSEK
jgi:hypothetical protein